MKRLWDLLETGAEQGGGDMNEARGMGEGRVGRAGKVGGDSEM